MEPQFKLSCPSCRGALVSLGANQKLRCDNCGKFFAYEQSGENIILKAVSLVGGTSVSSTTRENGDVVAVGRSRVYKGNVVFNNMPALGWFFAILMLLIIVLFAILRIIEILAPTIPTQEISGFSPEENTQPPLSIEEFTSTFTITASYTNTLTSTATITPVPSMTSSVTITLSPTILVAQLNWCKETPDQLCLNSFGTADGKTKHVFQIKFPTSPEFEIYLKVNGILFECNLLKSYPDRFRCEGPIQPTDERVLIQVFNIDDKQLLAEDRIPIFDEPTPSPDTPEPDEPGGPY